MQKPQRTSEKVNTPPEIFSLFPQIDLSVVFGVAGWVTYLEKEKGAPACCRAGAETEDDKEGATPAQSDTEGSDGQ